MKPNEVICRSKVIVAAFFTPSGSAKAERNVIFMLLWKRNMAL